MATVTFSYDRGAPHYEIGQAAVNRLRQYGVDTQYLKVLGGEYRIITGNTE